MNLTKVKSITLIDLFQGYPYKKNIKVDDNVVPFPYVKKEDIIYNEETLDYIQWRKIITRYFELLITFLKTGEEYKLPHALGFFQIKRYRVKRFFNRIDSTKEKKVYTYKNGIENQMFYIDWMRKYKEANLVYKWIWKFEPNRALLRSLYETADNDYTFVNRFKIGK